jgi:hypothetical protein
MMDCARETPYPNPLPASGEREGPAQREGEGHRRSAESWLCSKKS